MVDTMTAAAHMQLYRHSGGKLVVIECTRSYAKGPFARRAPDVGLTGRLRIVPRMVVCESPICIDVRGLEPRRASTGSSGLSIGLIRNKLGLDALKSTLACIRFPIALSPAISSYDLRPRGEEGLWAYAARAEASIPPLCRGKRRKPHTGHEQFTSHRDTTSATKRRNEGSLAAGSWCRAAAQHGTVREGELPDY
jgi:hypothetical protein